MKPTGILVGPSVAALLLQCDEFLRSTALGDSVVENGRLGSIVGFPVIEAIDMDETTLKIDFIIVNAEGVAAPMNVNSFVKADATAAGYPGGTILAGEAGYGLWIDENLVYIRKHA